MNIKSVLLLTQNIPDPTIFNQGIAEFKAKCLSVGLELDITQKETATHFSVIHFTNDVNSNGYQLNPNEILVEEKKFGTFDIDIIVFDQSKYSPVPTNPSDNAEIIQVPCNWYNVYPDVLSEFLLHELCHELFYETKQPDITHNYDPQYSTQPRSVWYLHLITGLLPLVTPQAPQVTTLTRGVQDSKETLGILTARNGSATFSCKTLELPYIGNMANVSCIPKGDYQVKYTFSLRLLKYTYEIQNTYPRSGIRIHSANYFSDLLGCIALGDSLVDINKDGEIDVANSKATIKLFEDFMQKKEFILTIN